MTALWRWIRPLTTANRAKLLFHYKDSNDEQSVQLKMLLQEKSLKAVVKEVTGLTDAALIEEIVASVESLD